MKVKDVVKAKSKNRMVSAKRPNDKLKPIEPIPKEAYENPVEWTRSLMRLQVPQAGKEVEYQLKFGDDKTRKELALEIMAMEGISSKGPAATNVVPAIQLILNAPLPWIQKEIKEEKKPELVEGQVLDQPIQKIP